VNTSSRLIATLSLAAIVGGGGYWAGKNDIGSLLQQRLAIRMAEAEPKPQPRGRVVYYSHPDGLAEYSAKPKNTDDGRRPRKRGCQLQRVWCRGPGG
jgi:Cu(I)/Ag(I) efflux system membrane fusion protein